MLAAADIALERLNVLLPAAGALVIAGLITDIFLLARLLVRPPDFPAVARRLLSRPWTWQDLGLVTVVFLFTRLVLQLMVETGRNAGLELLFTDPFIMIVLMVAVIHAPVLLTVSVLARLGSRSLETCFETRDRPLGSAAVHGIVYCVASYPAVLAVSYFYVLFLNSQGIEPLPHPLIKVLQAIPVKDSRILPLVISAVITGPLAEEFLFRGIALPVFSKRLGPVWAIVVVSLLFAALHPLTLLVPMFVLSLGLCLACAATGSITVSVVMHAMFNLISIAITIVSS